MASKNWAQAYEDAGGSDNTPIPDGEYNFVVQHAEHKTTQTGKDMYYIRAVVEDGPYAKRMIHNNFVVSLESEQAMSIFFRQMNGLGLKKEFWQTNPSDEQIVTALNGRRFSGIVGTRTWQGQDRNELKVVKPPKNGGPSGGAPVPPPPAPSAPPAPTAAPTPPPAPEAAPSPISSPPDNAPF